MQITASPLSPILSALRGHGETSVVDRFKAHADSDLSPEQLARANLPEKEKIGALCRQFEAVLLRQILNGAQKTVIKSNLTHESAASGIYQGMATDQLADGISKSGSFGFARSLEHELTRQLHISKDSHEK